MGGEILIFLFMGLLEREFDIVSTMGSGVLVN